ncbi:ribosome biogenesis factor YjgA [Ferrimonas balearica]|uniref:ribosome biogenesis factor YjgA n=1 Tax=Ferrimonas balearica TaxID=44012 RepID=UPI001C992E66|nr:ribosome biogenesis factor YjgA [Ferrimonas balearica]MBY5922484.1 ribosome-associated protein [Ferrimonas balearica]MBY5995468.1 ribosome-associated protein [Ferrimonas balearica]
MVEYEDYFEDDFISKSQLKREAEALQQLGEDLLRLTKAELAKVPLDEDLADAFALAHKIKGKHEAYRRQVQYIGKMMRSRDPEPLQEALDKIRNKHNQATAEFHKLEQLRDRLLSGGNDALQEVLAEHPALSEEMQRLRQLIRQAAKEQKESKPPKSSRELFKLLRSTLMD